MNGSVLSLYSETSPTIVSVVDVDLPVDDASLAVTASDVGHGENSMASGAVAKI